jgi:hypothetical protein
MQPTHTLQRDVSGACADFRVQGDQRCGAIKFFVNCVRGTRAIETPPIVGRANLPLGKITDVDGERPVHSRLRSSSRRSAIGVVWPRLH